MTICYSKVEPLTLFGFSQVAWDWPIYRISYLWFSAIGCFTVIIVGLLVSFLTGRQDVKKLNPKTISPAVFWLQKFIPGADQIGAEFVSIITVHIVIGTYDVSHKMQLF